MAEGLSRADLILSVQNALGDARGVFVDPDGEDIGDLLDIAAADLGRVRPLQRRGTVSVVAGQSEYPGAVPGDLVCVRRVLWGIAERASRQPWDPDYPPPAPCLSVYDDGAGARVLMVSPAPSARQVALLGSACGYLYQAAYRVADSAAQTTVAPGDRHLLVLRTVAEALAVIARHHVNRPVKLGAGLGSVPANGSAAALSAAALAQFERQAVR